MLTAAVGQIVTVDMGRRGGVQRGTVVALLPGDRFRWKNACNFERVARLSQLTERAPCEGRLDPYVQAWADDPGEE